MLDGAVDTIAVGNVTFLVEVHVNHGLDVPSERILERFGRGYALTIAPVEQDEDAFEAYSAESSVVRDRFFLLAVPV